MKISYIIPFRNREQTRLTNCITSLKNQTYEDVEIVVSIYGGNIPLTPYWDNLMVLYEETDNIWNRSKALNNGIKKCNGDIIVTTDVDMIFSPDVAQKTVDIIRKNENSYIYSNFVMMEKEDYEDKLISNDKQNLRKYLKGHNLFTMIGTGGYQGMLRKYWYKIKGFKEKYKGWGVEDVDLYKRALKEGLKPKRVDDVFVVHQWHISEIDKAKQNNDRMLLDAIAINNNLNEDGGEGDLI